jgi:hypothetical protein
MGVCLVKYRTFIGAVSALTRKRAERFRRGRTDIADR